MAERAPSSRYIIALTATLLTGLGAGRGRAIARVRAAAVKDGDRHPWHSARRRQPPRSCVGRGKEGGRHRFHLWQHRCILRRRGHSGDGNDLKRRSQANAVIAVVVCRSQSHRTDWRPARRRSRNGFHFRAREVNNTFR